MVKRAMNTSEAQLGIERVETPMPACGCHSREEIRAAIPGSLELDSAGT
jgi:hypothetical protein